MTDVYQQLSDYMVNYECFAVQQNGFDILKSKWNLIKDYGEVGEMISDISEIEGIKVIKYSTKIVATDDTNSIIIYPLDEDVFRYLMRLSPRGSGRDEVIPDYLRDAGLMY